MNQTNVALTVFLSCSPRLGRKDDSISEVCHRVELHVQPRRLFLEYLAAISAQARGNARVIPRDVATKSVRDKLLALIADWAIGLPPAVETDEAPGLFVGQAISRSPLAFLTRHHEEHQSDYTRR